MFIIFQNIKISVLMTLIKFFSYKLIIKNREVGSQTNKRTLVTRKEQNCLDWNSHKVKIDAKISTQIVISKTNLVPSQWQDNFNSTQNLAESSPEISNRLTKRITVKSKNILLDLAQVNFEEKIIETFIDRLSHPNLLQKELINTSSISDPRHIITILSSFVISENKRENLITAIREQIDVNAKIQFETRTENISGIELRDRGYKISWDLKHYLTELETVTANVLVDQNHVGVADY